ncbi:probable transcription factor At4g00390 [Setaria italica]|nr:probable transcription factor At4g00390 [Setaria italica]
MTPESSAAAAATGSGSDASDGEADAGRFYSTRPPGDPPRLRCGRGTRTPVLAAASLSRGAAASAPPASHSDSDAAAAGVRVPSPRRNRERTPRVHSDPDSDNSIATASEDGGGDASDAFPSPRARLSTHIKTSSIKPIRTRPMDVSSRDAAAASSELRTKHRPGYQKRPSRVWSPEDEVTILNALIEYRAKKGRLPASFQDTSDLYLQIFGQLTANVSTTQLSDKVRRLKHKYKLLVKRAKNERDPDLPTEHDHNVYELCEKVWRLKSLEGGDAESNEEQEIKESDEEMENEREHRERTSKKPKTSRFENANGNATVTAVRASHGNGSGRDDAEKGKQMYPYLWAAIEELSKEHPSGPIFRKAFGVLEKAKARAIEEKLRKFRMSVVRLQLNRMDLTKLSVGMVLDALEGPH